MKIILLAGSGGFIGSVARYGLQQLTQRLVPGIFPLGTLLVNITGCFAIGLIYGFAGRQVLFSSDWKLFLAIGLCGGFTTFSSFSYENIRLLQDGHALQALIYITASIIIGLAVTYAGILLAGK